MVPWDGLVSQVSRLPPCLHAVILRFVSGGRRPAGSGQRRFHSHLGGLAGHDFDDQLLVDAVGDAFIDILPGGQTDHSPLGFVGGTGQFQEIRDT